MHAGRKPFAQVQKRRADSTWKYFDMNPGQNQNSLKQTIFAANGAAKLLANDHLMKGRIACTRCQNNLGMVVC